MKMKNLTSEKIIHYIVIIILCNAAFFLGRYSKQCAKLVNEVHTTDTVTQYKTITPEPVFVSYPVNKTVNKTILKTDTVYRWSTFTSVDTLRLDSLYVTINDTGNCDGITSRGSQFFGKTKQEIVTNTITRTFMQPLPIFQLNAGVQTSFSGRYKALDVGFMVQVDFRRKFDLGYSYMMNSSTHNISLLTKIK